MEYYFKFKEDLYKKFIKIPKNFQETVIDKITGEHGFTQHIITDLLADEGIEYFKQRGIILDSLAGVYKVIPNFSGPWHVDVRKISINAVINGSGTMEWGNNIKGKILYYEHNTKNGLVKIPTYENVRSYKVLDKLDTKKEDFFIARINAPHRVVNNSLNEERVILAFRIQSGLDNLDYDSVIDNFK